MMGRLSSSRSWGLLAVTSHAARHSGLTMPSLSCKKMMHSGFRFMQSSNKAQAETVLRFQSRSCHPINASKKNQLCSRLRNNDHKNDLKFTLLNAVFRSSHKATTAERFKDVIFCIKRFISWQFENQASHRLQKSLRYYSKYSKICKDQSGALQVFSTLRRMLLTRGHLLVSAIGVYSYDWENNKISDDAIKRGARDLEILEELFKRTIICPKCGKRQVIDQKIATVVYCMCDGKLGYTDKSRTYDGWEPFIERDNVIVWRKPHQVHTHLFHFKVYGRYEDVSLSAFMESQLNTHFRTEWDFTALQLSILHSQKDSNSDLLYWLVKFPSFFSNRDYLFKRRFHIDAESQEVTIMNEALEGDEVLPETKGVVRVSEYWSNTVIRPLEGISKPGMEYTLTYFDNPGTRLPQSVSNFIASTGFPNFLKQNHNAALTLQSRYENGEDVYESLPYSLRYPHVELDLKTSEVQLAIEDEVQETLTLGIQDEVHETPALHIMLETKSQIAESNQAATHTQIEYQEPCIQYQIEEKSDFLRDDDSHIATIKKDDELEIKDINKLIKEEPMSFEREENIIPTENVVIHEETLTKEELLDNEIKVKIDNLKEKEIPSECNENERIFKDTIETSKIDIKNELVSEVMVENNIDLDKSTLSIESKTSKDNIEYRTVSEESNKNSQRENKNIVQIEKNESLPDMKVEVILGSKKVIVDLLEAMEVISPELEQKTVLLQKVEKWAEAALKDIDDNTEFIQKVKKICSKIEKFKERAKNKKIQSLRIMEEMEKQTNKEEELKPRIEFGHYDHSGGLDERTLLMLEKFLFTMKDVIDKDKDMRTGRGYSIDSCENLENSQRYIFRKRMSKERNTEINPKILRENRCQEEILKDKINENPIKIENKKIQIINKYDKKIRVDESDIDIFSEDVTNASDKEKEDDPPKDPPAPTPSSTETKPEGNHERVNIDNMTSTETNQINKGIKSEVPASESEGKMVNSSTDSWIYRYVPVMTYFGSGNRVPDDKLDLTKSDKIEVNSSHKVDSQSSSWYMLGLDGYFKKNPKAQESDSSVCRKETENAKGCDNVDSNGITSWYWYPIIGMHKLYSWAWNAGVQV